MKDKNERKEFSALIVVFGRLYEIYSTQQDICFALYGSACKILQNKRFINIH